MTEQESFRPEFHQSELVCTLPRGPTREFLTECKNLGVDYVRVHSGKMDSEAMIELINNSQAVGLRAILDLGGKKPRVRKSLGMTQFQEGPEKGNWCRSVAIGERVVIVSEDANDEETLEVKRALELPDNTFAVKVSYVPPLTGEGKEQLSFADGKILCRVDRTYVAETNRSENGQVLALELEVLEVKNTEGLFWNMGVNSPTNDIFSGRDSVLTSADVNVLKAVYGQARPDQIALSFVSYPEQAAEARRRIGEIGYNLEEIEFAAKIETLTGVENINSIARLVDVVIVARGDLADACARVDKDLMEAEKEIIEGTKETSVKVVIATGVADSLVSKVKEREKITRLSRDERVRVAHEFPISDGFWLSAETMITGEKAPQIIERTKRAIEVARRYWRDPEGWREWREKSVRGE